MPLQYITDNTGAHTAVVIPINEWEKLTQKHKDLKILETKSTKENVNPLGDRSSVELVEKSLPPKPKIKLSDYAGKLSHETAEAMLNYVAESRNEWEERLNKQL